MVYIYPTHIRNTHLHYQYDISVAHKNLQHLIRRKAYNGTSEVMWILRTNVVGCSVLPVHTSYITDLCLFLPEKHDGSPYSIRAAENLTRSACVCGGINTTTRPLHDSFEWKYFFFSKILTKILCFKPCFRQSRVANTLKTNNKMQAACAANGKATTTTTITTTHFQTVYGTKMFWAIKFAVLYTQ